MGMALYEGDYCTEIFNVISSKFATNNSSFFLLKQIILT